MGYNNSKEFTTLGHSTNSNLPIDFSCPSHIFHCEHPTGVKQSVLKGRCGGEARSNLIGYGEIAFRLGGSEWGGRFARNDNFYRQMWDKSIWQQ